MSLSPPKINIVNQGNTTIATLIRMIWPVYSNSTCRLWHVYGCPTSTGTFTLLKTLSNTENSDYPSNVYFEITRNQLGISSTAHHYFKLKYTSPNGILSSFGEVIGTLNSGQVEFDDEVTVFTELGDVPNTYEDQAGKATRVNALEEGLEFYTPTDVDEKVKIDAVDTTAGYLSDKLISGSNISLTSYGVDKVLRISSNQPSSAFTSTGLNTFYSDVSTIDGGELNIDYDASVAWINNFSENWADFVEWTSGSVPVDPSTTNYIQYESTSGTIVSDTTAPDLDAVPLLATVVTDANGIRFIHDTQVMVTNFPRLVDQYLTEVQPKILSSGLMTSVNADVTKFDISSGSYWYRLKKQTFDTITTPIFSYFYGTDGANEISSFPILTDKFDYTIGNFTAESGPLGDWIDVPLDPNAVPFVIREYSSPTNKLLETNWGTLLPDIDGGPRYNHLAQLTEDPAPGLRNELYLSVETTWSSAWLTELVAPIHIAPLIFVFSEVAFGGPGITGMVVFDLEPPYTSLNVYAIIPGGAPSYMFDIPIGDLLDGNSHKFEAFIKADAFSVTIYIDGIPYITNQAYPWADFSAVTMGYAGLGTWCIAVPGGFSTSVTNTKYDNFRYGTGVSCVDTTNYDNAGALAPLVAGHFRSDTLYLTSDGRLSLIYGTTDYATQIEAENTEAASAFSAIELSAFPLARLIVEQGIGIAEVIDARIISGARSTGIAVADATGAGDVVAQLNALLARIRELGLIAV